MKFIYSLLVVSLLVGCGADSGKLLSEEFTGVWEQESANGQTVRDRYLLIKSNGSYSKYLYSIDTQNCYEIYNNASISHVGESTYIYEEQDFQSELEMEITEDNKLLISGRFESYDFEDVYVATDLYESDLKPLCNE